MLHLTHDQAIAYVIQHETFACCEARQRRLAFLPPFRVLGASHLFPAASCASCGEVLMTGGWRSRVWEWLCAPFWDGRVAHTSDWIDPPLAR